MWSEYWNFSTQEEGVHLLERNWSQKFYMEMASYYLMCLGMLESLFCCSELLENAGLLFSFGYMSGDFACLIFGG